MLLDPKIRSEARFLKRFTMALIEEQGKINNKNKKSHKLKRKIKVLDPVIESLVG